MAKAETVYRAAIAASSSGDNTLVAASTGKEIRVLGYTIVAAGAVAVKFKSNGVDLSGAMSLAANGGVSVPPVAVEDFAPIVGADGSSLVLNLGGAVAVGGHLTYQLV